MANMGIKSTLFLFLSLLNNNNVANGFSISAELAQMTRGRLFEALYSPSGKLTFSPEVIIPEPSDPTALLLQSTEVIKISEKLRSKGKINAAFLSGSFSSVNAFVKEQEEARGSFPGPVPVIYCAFSGIDSSNAGDDDDDNPLEVLAEYGCSGIVTSVCEGKSISNVDDLKDSSENWIQAALNCGIQPIPEVVLSMEKSWGVDDISCIIDILREKCENDDGPVSVVITFDNALETVDDDDDDDDDSQSAADEAMWDNVPELPKSISKNFPILGSVRVGSLDELNDYSTKLKSKGFTGAFLRADCVPGFRMNPDLDFVAGFWSAVISDLKSTKSKNFEFRTKTKLEKDVPLEWLNYQKDVMESGALGATSAKAASEDLNTENGDYQGF